MSCGLTLPAICAFHNHLIDATRIPQHLRTLNCTECCGVTIALAPAVRGQLPDKTFTTFSASMLRWTCLACPTVGRSRMTLTLLPKAHAGVMRLRDQVAAAGASPLQKFICRMHLLQSLPIISKCSATRPPPFLLARWRLANLKRACWSGRSCFGY